MVCASMAELLIQYKVIYIAFKSLFQQACGGINAAYQKRGKSSKFFAKNGNVESHVDIVEDPALPKDVVKDWMWMLGLLVTIVIAMIICQLQWVNSLTSPLQYNII